MTSSWVGGDGNWNDNTQWDSALFPDIGNGGLTYDATIDSPGSFTVSLNTDVTLDSVTLNSSGGTLDLSSGNDFSFLVGFNLQRGTIIGGTITSTGSGGLSAFAPGTSTTGTLDGVTLDTDLAIGEGSSGNRTVTVLNGLTLEDGRVIDIAAGPSGFTSNLDFSAGDQTLGVASGSAEVRFNGNPNIASRNTIQATSGGTLTIGSGVTVRTDTASGQVGNANTGLVNQGTLSAQTNGETININGSNIDNQGTIQAINGATLSLLGPWTSTGVIRVIDDAVVNLGGSFTTAGLGTIDRTGGTNQGKLNLTGTLDNSGGPGVLTLNDTTGVLNIRGGTIIGGTITSAGSGSFALNGGDSGALDGVTLDTDLAVGDGNQGFVTMTVLNGLTLEDGHAVDIAAGPSGFTSNLDFSGDQTLGVVSGSADVRFNGNPNAPSRNKIQATDGGTLTIGTGVTVRTDTASGEVGNTNNGLVNQGTISAQTSGEIINVNGSSIENQGVFESAGGATLNVLNNASTLTNLSGSTLTGGTYRVFADSTLNMGTASIVNNHANVTLSGPNSTFAAIEPLSTNNGAFRVLANRDFTAVAGFMNTGQFELGGGTFNATSFTNNATGELLGFGTVTPRPTNSGLIRAAGGTLVFGQGIQGDSGTVRVDAGAAMDLSGGSMDSNADFLNHGGAAPGSLNLGSNNFVVSVDYTNTNFGHGNSFDRRANVAGSGQIRADGDVTQRLTGDVGNGATPTATLEFGNVHVGDSVTQTYQIANGGTTGSSLRGAIQTSVNGANLTDPRLGGVGVTASNFGAIAPGSDSGNLEVTFSATSSGDLTGQQVHITNNFDNVAGQDLLITAAGWNLALASDHSPEPVVFGNVHENDPAPQQALSVTNQAPDDGFSERLNAQLGATTGGVTASGSFGQLAPQATDDTSLVVGIDTSTAGDKSGTAQIVLESDGTGTSELGKTGLPSQTVNVTGRVFRLADPSEASPDPVDFGILHVGDTSQRALTITNQAANDGVSEAFNAAFTDTTGDVTATGSISLLGPLVTDNTSLVVSVDTATAGFKSGTATIGLESDGTGSSGLGISILADQVIDISGQVNHFADPVVVQLNGDGSLSGADAAFILDLGTILQGDLAATAILGILNDTLAPADTLAGGFDVSGAAAFVLSGFEDFDSVNAGNTSTNLSISLESVSVGLFSGTVTLNPRSRNTGGFDGALPSIAIDVVGEVVIPEPSSGIFLLAGGLALLRRRATLESGRSTLA